MAFFPEDTKRDIRDRIRLEDLVRDYNVVLQPAGRSRYRALCPFHSEKTPSFHVIPDWQIFHCFGCKKKGDLFTFVQEMEHVTFPEAVEILARRAGVEIESTPAARRARGEKTAIYDALSLAESYYHALLMSDPRARPARDYLERRGIDPSMWERFRLGYSLPEWRGLLNHARSKGLEAGILEKAGLARRKEGGRADGEGGASHRGGSGHVYDLFRGRIMFPIADGQKRVIGFGARALGDDQPKYINTPRTAVFDKSQVLYGLPQARAAIQDAGRIAIVEGYTDVIAAHQEGIEYVVASLGTAFTSENARRLRRLAGRVDLVFDGDLAGQGAAERSLDLLVSEDLDVRVLMLSGGEDPFDAITSEGGERFRTRLDADALGIFEFKWRRALGDDPRSRGAAETARAFDEVLDLLGRVPNVVARKLHAVEFAERLGIPAADVEKRLEGRQRRHRRSRSARPEVRFPRSGPAGAGPAATAPAAPAASPSGSAGGGEHAGGGPGRAAPPGLEEVIIEALLTEPDRARARWGTLPPGFFERAELDPAVRSVATAIGRQLEDGDLDVERLVGLLGGEEGIPLLATILGRIDRESAYGESDRWHIATDTDETWERCLRDIERRQLQRRRAELLAIKERARAAGDTDALLAAGREYREILRALAGQPSRRP